jgi:hypothetical protein
MKTLHANQIPKVERPWLQPRYLVHLIMPGETLYFSDRNFQYNGHTYEDYLTNIPETLHEIEISGGYGNISAQFNFKNKPFRAYASLIEFFIDNPLVFCEADVFVLYLNSTGETFGSDVSTKLHRVTLGEFKSIKRQSFQAELSSIVHGLDNEEIFKQINTTDWPNADPADVGKYENLIYGTIRDVPCHCVLTGAVSNLFLDMDAAVTSVVLSEVDYPIPFPNSGTIQIDDEQIIYTGKSSATKTLTGCTRGVSPTIHTRGAPVWLVISTYKYLIAGQILKSAANAKTGQIRIDPADYTVNLNDGGKSVITFTDKQLMKIQGMHSHPVNTDYRQNANSGSLTSSYMPYWNVTGVEGNMRDQSDITSVRAIYQNTNWGQTFNFNVFFPAVIGNIKEIYACITHKSSPLYNNVMTLTAFFNGGSEVIGTPYTTGAQVTQKFRLTTTKQITELTYYLKQMNLGQLDVTVYEFWLEYIFDETGGAAAVGVWGNPEDVLNPPIMLDVEGYVDDGLGTYTGTPNKLIDNPSDVRRHFLMATLGRASGDIGASFATARALYAARISGGYKFGMILSRIGDKPSSILKALDEQSRSNTSEEGGKFELWFNGIDPGTVKILDGDDMIGEPVFDQAGVFNVRDKVRATYDIDWANSSIFTGHKFGQYRKQTEKGGGTHVLDVEFPAIQIPAMADDVVDWILTQHEIAWPSVQLTCNRAARALEKGDQIELDYLFWGYLTWRVNKIREIPQRQAYLITANGLGYVGFILMEDGFDLLQEDGAKLII